MPRIPERFLDCAIFLYSSRKDAEDGARYGGSGFMVGIQSRAYSDRWHLYAVTNRHVIKGGAVVIRLSRLDGTEVQENIIDTKEDSWIFLREEDIAVLPIREAKETHWTNFVRRDDFLDSGAIARHEIGPGDDVFSVGRLTGHEGKQRNTPVVRFGNIAMMPAEPIRQENGHAQESFLVESRSFTGYSGSPVFVFLQPWTFMEPDPDQIESGESGPWLLGVDWGHPGLEEPVYYSRTGSIENLRGTPSGLWIRANSGRMYVVPVSQLVELLDSAPARVIREQEDNRLSEEKMNLTAVSDITLPCDF